MNYAIECVIGFLIGLPCFVVCAITARRLLCEFAAKVREQEAEA